MRTDPANTAAALAAGKIVTREFLRIVARNRDTGAPVAECFWSDLGEVSAPVIDPDTGGTLNLQFFGAGSLISIDPVAKVSDLTVPRTSITFSQLSDRVNDLLRNYDIRQARVDLWRGLYDPETMTLADPAQLEFSGFIDGAPVTTPAEGEAGDVRVECVSHTQEFTRFNADVRSDDSQQRRAPGDRFFRDVVSVGDWVINWGNNGPATAATAPAVGFWSPGNGKAE